jgi:ABC-2 type transport system permease protein
MSEPVAPVPLGLWPAVWKLLRLRAQILFSGFRRAKMRNKIGLVTLALVLLAFLVFMFWASFALLRFMRSEGFAAVVPDAGAFLNSVPVLALEGGFLVIFLTSFGVLLQALYLAGDMDFLLSAPIPIRAVFVSKLLQAILPSLALVTLLTAPVLFGFGVEAGYNLLYYPLVLVMLLALALAAAGVASLVVMGIVRIFPARRVAEVLGFFGAILSLVCSQSGNLARGQVSAGQVGAAVSVATRLDASWLPPAWAGRGVVSIAQGNWLPGVGYSVLALGTAGLVFGLALTMAERLYYSGWARMQGKPRAKRSARPAPRTSAQPLAGLTGRFVPRSVGAIVAKDWAMLRRDLRNLSQLITPLILGIVYALMIGRRGGIASAGQGEAPGWFMTGVQTALNLAGVGIALFVGWTLLARLAAMGFSQEGKSYWLLKTAPVSPGRLIAAKYLVAYLPSLALGGGFVIVLAFLQRSVPGTQPLWLSLPIVALCLAAVTGIYLSFGVGGARMDWEDPRQMITGRAGCLGALLTGLAMLVALALFSLPQVGLLLLGLPALVGQLVGLALGGVFCVACAWLPLRLLRDKVVRLGES